MGQTKAFYDRTGQGVAGQGRERQNKARHDMTQDQKRQERTRQNSAHRGRSNGTEHDVHQASRLPGLNVAVHHRAMFRALLITTERQNKYREASVNKNQDNSCRKHQRQRYLVPVVFLLSLSLRTKFLICGKSLVDQCRHPGSCRHLFRKLAKFPIGRG